MDNENIEFKNLPIGVQYMSWIKNDLHNLMLNLVIYIYIYQNKKQDYNFERIPKNYSTWVFLDRQIN